MSWFFIIFTLCSLSFFALASAMAKHQKQIFLKELDATKTRIAQISGYFLLILSLVLCINQSTISVGMSYWVGALTLAALMIGLSLSYYASHLKKIGYGLVIVLIISIIIYLN